MTEKRRRGIQRLREGGLSQEDIEEMGLPSLVLLEAGLEANCDLCELIEEEDFEQNVAAILSVLERHLVEAESQAEAFAMQEEDVKRKIRTFSKVKEIARRR